MGVVARQQNEFACPHLDGGITVDANLHVPGGDKMRGDDMSGCRQERLAIIRRESAVDAPGRSQLRLEEDASRQPDHTQHIRKRIQQGQPSFPESGAGNQAYRSFTA
ncbi:hypothetical protein D3C81_1901780 [compost metagenome]